jgi:hypothetical protein
LRLLPHSERIRARPHRLPGPGLDRVFPTGTGSRRAHAVLPRVHARTLFDIDVTSAGALLIAATNVARMLSDSLRPDGMTMFQTNERAGWQSVFQWVVQRRLVDALQIT